MKLAFRLSYGAKMMFISIVSFSLMHLCVKAIPDIPVHQLISFRSVFSILICVYILKSKAIPMWGNNKPILLARGFVGTLSLLCFFYSIQHLPLATAITVSNLIPLFALGLSALFIKEKITWTHALFFLISFVGVLLLKGFDTRVSLLDLSIALLAAFFTACAHFTVRKLRDTDHPWVIIFYFPLVAIPLIVPYTLFHWVWPTPFEWSMLVLVGVFTHIGQVYLTYAYAHEEVSGVTNIYYIGILLSLFYGYLLFEETFPWSSYVGMSLILLGVFLNLKQKKKV
jgi:drug/metabolite transporter (DMT)-like permease